MMTLFLLIHIIVCAFIILLVLVQQGKGATMGAAFGSGASQTVFGSRGSGSFLLKLTITCATIFFITGIALNYLTMKQAKALKHETPINLPTSVLNETPANTSALPLNKSDALPVSPDVIPESKTTNPKNK